MRAPTASDIERQALLGAIAGGLAHELRNPLSTMLVHLQLLREDWASPATTKERLSLKRIDILLREAQRLEDVLSDFLRFAGGHHPTLQPGNLNLLVQETLDFIAPEAERNGVRLETSLSGDLPQVPLDGPLFKQALLNILLNAEQAMPNGGTISVSTSRDSEAVRLAVRDTGKGIEPEILARIFDVYFSTKPNGSGLGLATTRRIVEEHGGRIEVESAPGAGAMFTIRLPAFVPASTGATPA